MLVNITIKSKIGKGSFGEVYLGVWDGTNVALKKLSEGQAATFRREAELLW